jgi:hypothetical protein
MRNLFFLFYLFFATTVTAQLQYQLSDAAAFALGGNTTTYSALQTIQNNPALFAKQKNDGVLISVGLQNRFQLADINFLQGGVLWKKKENGFGISFQNIGVTDVQQSKIGLNYGRRLFQKLAIGARFHVSQLNLGTYGNNTLVDADLGLFSSLNKQVSFGFWVKNLAHSRINSDESVQTNFHLGVSYTPSTKTSFNAEVEKNLLNAPRLKVGIEYLPSKNIFVRIGFVNSPAMPSFGIGYATKNIRLDIGASSHQQLGIVSAANVSYQF